MTRDLWNDVDEYLIETVVQPDAALSAALQASDAAGLPAIAVSPCLGKLLHNFARMMSAKSILEIGTLGGFSTIWLARALPADGKIITLEIDPNHAEIACSNFERAGVAPRIELRLGPALESLPRLVAENRGPFDLIFIDADKPAIPKYFSWAMKMVHVGSAIIVDNVIRNGEVANAVSTDDSVQGVRRLMTMLADEPRISATAIQTVGMKGYDGFLLAVVNAL